jgi:hypothetical protein
MQPYAAFAYPLITAAIATTLPGRGDLTAGWLASRTGLGTVGQ